MLIAHISDAHITDKGTKAFGIAPMAENLALCVAHINGQKLQPDLVLITGDITNDHSLSQAEYAAEILQGLRAPYYIVPGNHDDRDALWQVFGGTAIPSRSDGFLQYVIKGRPLRLIGLDSLSPDRPGGAFCNSRARWLQEQLSQHCGPTLLFMHHPPLLLGVPETDVDGFENANLLADIVRTHPNILRVLCGHVHLETHCQWQGTTVCTAGSMGMGLEMDLANTTESRFRLSAPTYLLHHWTGDSHLVSHNIPVRPPEPSYAFEDPP